MQNIDSHVRVNPFKGMGDNVYVASVYVLMLGITFCLPMTVKLQPAHACVYCVTMRYTAFILALKY